MISTIYSRIKETFGHDISCSKTNLTNGTTLHEKRNKPPENCKDDDKKQNKSQNQDVGSQTDLSKSKKEFKPPSGKISLLSSNGGEDVRSSAVIIKNNKSSLKKNNNSKLPSKREAQCQTRKTVAQNVYEVFRKTMPFSSLYRYPMDRSCSVGDLSPVKEEDSTGGNLNSMPTITHQTKSTSSLNDMEIPYFCRKIYLEDQNRSGAKLSDCSVVQVSEEVFQRWSNTDISETSTKSESDECNLPKSRHVCILR